MHVHGGLNPTLGLVAPEAADDLGLPVVATFHSWFERSALCRLFRRPLQRRLDRHAAVVAVSQPVVEAHARYFEADWEIIPNGVDTEFFRPARGTEARGAPSSCFWAGWIRATGSTPCSRRRRRWSSGSGGAPHGGRRRPPLGPVYERLARRWAAPREFVGRVNGDRPRHYAPADPYLCPTTKASFGITLLEAMACGTPMLVSDITG